MRGAKFQKRYVSLKFDRVESFHVHQPSTGADSPFAIEKRTEEAKLAFIPRRQEDLLDPVVVIEAVLRSDHCIDFDVGEGTKDLLEERPTHVTGGSC